MELFCFIRLSKIHNFSLLELKKGLKHELGVQEYTNNGIFLKYKYKHSLGLEKPSKK